jgi:hypothetical protein
MSVPGEQVLGVSRTPKKHSPSVRLKPLVVRPFASFPFCLPGIEDLGFTQEEFYRRDFPELIAQHI